MHCLIYEISFWGEGESIIEQISFYLFFFYYYYYIFYSFFLFLFFHVLFVKKE